MAQPEVFISHSTQDRTIAGLVCQALEQKHIACWIAPRDIPLGLNAFDSIPLGITQCRVLVLILSANASKSEYVQRELQIALTNKKIIIPLRIEDIKLDGAVDFLLTGVQWLDAFVPPLERHLDALVSRIAAVTQAEATIDDSLRRGEDPFSALKCPSRPSRPWLPWALTAILVIVVAVSAGYLVLTRSKGSASAPIGTTAPVPSTATSTIPTATEPAKSSTDPVKLLAPGPQAPSKITATKNASSSGNATAETSQAATTPEQLRSRAAVMTAKTKMQQQDYVSAENYFRLAYELDPENAAAKVGLDAARRALSE